MGSTVGFRFKPTDEEIIFLLKMKRLDPDFSVDTITELDIYSYEPWELPRFCVIQSKEEVWYFFCEPDYKYAKSKREHRKTKTGYWKSTGKGSKMKAKKSREVIGNKRILPFSSPKNPNTEWVMHEISVEDDPFYKRDFVICRIERKRYTKRGISTSDDDQLSPDLGSRNHVAENSGLDSDVVASGHEIAHHKNHHDAENTWAEPRLPEEFNPGDGCNGVSNDASLSALPSPFHPEQESSYSNGSSYGCDILNTQVNNEINSQRAVQDESSDEDRGQTFTPDFNNNSSTSDESSREATGETFSPDFNSSKSDGRVYVENSSDITDMDSEAFLAWAEVVIQNEQIPSINMMLEE